MKETIWYVLEDIPDGVTSVLELPSGSCVLRVSREYQGVHGTSVAESMVFMPSVSLRSLIADYG